MTKRPDNLVELVNANGNMLYRVGETGCWHGDFYYILTDGEEGFIDTSYLIENGDEPLLVASFINDYKGN